MGSFEKTAFIAEGKYWVNNHAHVLDVTEANDTLLENYLVKLDINPFITGAAPPKLTLGKLKEIPIPIPSLPKEQQKIAACLSSLDALVAAQADKLEALKQHKKGLMQQLFPSVGEKLPALRFPEFRKAGEWEEKEIDAICSLQAGKYVKGSEIADEKNNSFLYPCYGGNGLRGFTRTYNYSGVYPLIGRQGALCGNVNFVSGNFYATEHALVATVKEGISIDWLFYKLVLLNLNQYATGQAQPGLSVDSLKKILCFVPKDKKEQQKIAACLSSLDALVATQVDKLEALKQHKKGLMQQLFPSAKQ